MTKVTDTPTTTEPFTSVWSDLGQSPGGRASCDSDVREPFMIKGSEPGIGSDPLIMRLREGAASGWQSKEFNRAA